MASAATLAPLSSFNASTSSSQKAHNGVTPAASSTYSDNPLTQLPQVDLNFEDLRQRMAAFTAKFDAFIERGRKRVLEERNEFRARLGELAEDRKTTSSRITSLTGTLQTHAQLLAHESAERADLLSSVASLEAQSMTSAAACGRLRTAIAATQRQIDAKLDAQRAYGEKIDGQARMNGPELAFWETYLGMRIEGSGREDVVRIVFAFEASKAASGAGEREAVVELKVPDRGGYEVVHTKPRLEDASVAICLDRLNQNRDVGAFSKAIRALFTEVMK